MNTPNAGRIIVIGTAGHVDHGKSALVRALTGSDPDRLAEEQARGMTIDLGFAWSRLPSGALASFVDVPGHEDFIRNMLAGAGGIDAALLVIAADEGPMPQTLEHLAILDLLGIAHAVVALTKIDLVDADWLALVTEAVAALLAKTALAGAPIVPVSALTGAGLEELVTTLDAVLGAAPAAPDHGRARMAIDRAFTMSGFGTVITGTLRDGVIRAGDPLEVLPAGLRSRARGLHGYGQPVELAMPGTRTAINLAGLSTEQLRRGDVVAPPGLYTPTQLIDVEVELLAARDGAGYDAGYGKRSAGITHDTLVHLFHGAAEIPAHVRVIDAQLIPPGGRGPAQLRLAQPAVLVAGDRFVLRQPSPGLTIGGGVVLDPHPAGRRRRFRATTVDHFVALSAGTAEDRLYALVAEREPCRAEALPAQDTGLDDAERATVLAQLAQSGRLVPLGPLGELWITAAGWHSLKGRIEALLSDFHVKNPLRAGMQLEELRTRLGLTAEVFSRVLARAAAEGWAAAAGEVAHLPQHEVSFDRHTRAAVDDLLARFRADPYAPPAEHEAREAVGKAAVAALVARGELVAVGGDVLFTADTFEVLKAGVLEHIAAHGQVTVADVRDRFGTSRKYALALLEYLDKVRVTRRVGDARVAVRREG